MATKKAGGSAKNLTDSQAKYLGDDFGLSPFAQRGGLGRAHQLFGDKLPQLLEELNQTLAA